MKTSPDTNVFLRLVVGDNLAQSKAAERLLRNASLVVITLPCLCEFVWVLRTVYRFRRDDVAAAIHRLLQIENVSFDVHAVAAGLAVLESGGDFADGIIAHLGRQQGGTTFASFDRKAVAILKQLGHEATLLQ